MKKGEEYLLKIKKSRKAYFVFYLMALFVLVTIGYLYYQGYSFEYWVLLMAGVFIIGGVFIIEIIHQREWWAITESSLIHSLSILNKNVREVDLSSISDLDLDKPLIKRVLNYGTVNVRVFLNETTIRVKNITKPEIFINLLQELISKNRDKKNGLK